MDRLGDTQEPLSLHCQPDRRQLLNSLECSQNRSSISAVLALFNYKFGVFVCVVRSCVWENKRVL